MLKRQIHILNVGIPPADVHMHLVGLNTAMKDHDDIDVMHITSESFDEAAMRVLSLPELDIVSISNRAGISNMKLYEGCIALSTEIAMHAGNPWVHLTDAKVYFAGTMFRNLNIRTTERRILDLILDRRKHKERLVQS